MGVCQIGDYPLVLNSLRTEEYPPFSRCADGSKSGQVCPLRFAPRSSGSRQDLPIANRPPIRDIRHQSFFDGFNGPSRAARHYLRGMEEEARKPAYPVGAVDNALRLLLLFRDRKKLRVSEAGRAIGVASSTAHRLLDTLRYHGFVQQDAESRAYEPGPALTALGLAAVRELDLRTCPALISSTSESAALCESLQFREFRTLYARAGESEN